MKETGLNDRFFCFEFHVKHSYFNAGIVNFEGSHYAVNYGEAMLGPERNIEFC